MKVLSLIATLCLLSLVAMAQPTYNASNLPTIGLATVWTVADTNDIHPGPAGPDQAWDFSMVKTTSESSTLNYLDPANTPYASEFPSATLAEKSDTAWSYYTLGNGRWTRLGESSEEFQSGEWSNPLDMALVPWTYGQSFSDDAAHQFVTQGVTTNRTGTITATYDGYGTLTLPQGTFKNVMRMQYRQVIHDSAVIQAGPVSIGTGITTDIVAWVWYQEGNNQPLLALDTADITIVTGPPANQYQHMRFPHVQITNQTPSGGSGPLPPSLVGPANEARIPGTEVTLEWTQPADNLRTQVQVAIDAAFTAIVVDETTTEESYTATGLELGRTYFWRASTVAVSGTKQTDGQVQENSEWTATRSFTMVPTAPMLTSPVDQSVVDAPSGMVQFTWTPTTGKSHFQLATDDAFTTLVKEVETEESSVDYTLDAGQAPYHWRVRNLAANSVAGEWSATSMFTFAVVSVNETDASPLAIGPNPTSTVLDVKFESGLFYQVLVMDLQGRMRSSDNITPEQASVQMSVANLESGTYQLVLVGRHGSVSETIQVLH